MSGLWGRELAASSYLVTGTSSSWQLQRSSCGLAGSGQFFKKDPGGRRRMAADDDLMMTG